MSENEIIVRGASEHNLKNIDVRIPRDKLVVVTGVSGSGKSSLAFDTIYAEGQRRYVESLSAYARQFLGRMEKPEVDHIEGLSPSISIDQKGVSRNPRSTVGTVTEIYDYLRLLFARAGRPHCRNCGKPVQRQTVQQIVDSILRLDEGSRLLILAPVIKHKKGEHTAIFDDARRTGFVRVRVDGEVVELSEDISLNKNQWHNIEIVVDRVIVRKTTERERLTQSVETALKASDGTLTVSVLNPSERLVEELTSGARSTVAAGTINKQRQRSKSGLQPQDLSYSEQFSCPDCDISMSELEPRNFSFNTPFGACTECSGIGFRLEIDPDLVLPNKNVSLSDGAVAPWSRDGKNSQWAWGPLRALNEHFEVPLNKPITELEPDHLKLVLYGSGRKRVQLRHETSSGAVFSWKGKIEGVIPNLERRHANTESENVRNDIERYMSQRTCNACNGDRLKPDALAVTLLGMNIMEVTRQSVEIALQWVEACRNGAWDLEDRVVEEPLTTRELSIADQIFKEIESRLGFLSRVGLNYLTLDRSAGTLSGGEGQRIRLATQIGSGLMGVLYVCDEPSVGLHPHDGDRLIATLKSLRDVGNTVLIVEHDEAVMRAADHIVDLGPGAGEHGGHVVAQGEIDAIIDATDSITGDYLSGRKEIASPKNRREIGQNSISIIGARANNLKNVDIDIPLGVFVCVTGVSGSGKSTLVNEIILKSLSQHFYRAKDRPGPHDEITGLDHIDKVINIDQSPIGRTPRSNPATYTGVFTPIRELYATVPEARARGYTPGRFSFNVRGGRCESCSGAGYTQIEMQFLPDVTVPCEVCDGARYNREALEILFKEASISDVLNMTVTEAHALFENIPKIASKLVTLMDVGLGYIRLGQPATTLSGGEAQRIKLASELSKRSTGQTLYILDEPTTGLSFDDAAKLLTVLHRLVDNGNTVLLIEHHLDLIKNADWIIDLGPFAGDDGGELVAVGTPEFIASVDDSFTGNYLRDFSGIIPDEGAHGSDEFQQNGRHDTALKNGAAEIKIADILNDQDMAAARSKASRNGASRGRRRRRRRRAVSRSS
ncbi:MAG: excinuclease ABC subunit UvrA [Chloroflexi bacterium]|nr:excinuclease ABC subunit UvrA [Chloroflexota bacterium]MYK60450.1 excinuclease ABC subunit UvrA [Chloroflexota bacterium]